jgi:hypothetical protein
MSVAGEKGPDRFGALAGRNRPFVQALLVRRVGAHLGHPAASKPIPKAVIRLHSDARHGWWKVACPLWDDDPKTPVVYSQSGVTSREPVSWR